MSYLKRRGRLQFISQNLERIPLCKHFIFIATIFQSGGASHCCAICTQTSLLHALITFSSSNLTSAHRKALQLCENIFHPAANSRFCCKNEKRLSMISSKVRRNRPRCEENRRRFETLEIRLWKR